MNLDGLKQHWLRKNQRLAEQRFDDMLRNIVGRADRLERTILRRDRIESTAALLVLGAFACALWRLPFPRMAQAGILIIMAGCIEIIVVMRWVRTKDELPPSDAPLVDFSRAELTRVNRQIKLLQTVNWWYSGPILLGVGVFFGGLLWSEIGLPVATAGLFSCGFALCLLLAGLIIYRINQRAVESELIPLRDELAELVNAFEEDATPT